MSHDAQLILAVGGVLAAGVAAASLATRLRLPEPTVAFHRGEVDSVPSRRPRETRVPSASEASAHLLREA